MSDYENDFKLDVTDLSAGADDDTGPSLDENTASAADQHNKGIPSGPSPLMGGWIQRMPRRVRAIMVVGIVLLAVVLVVLVDPALRSSLSIALRGPAPAPSPTLPGEANLVFLESGAPWGTFSLDGHAPTPLSQQTLRLSSVWIRLTPGHHTIQVRQPPFRPLTCRISLPADRSDTCPLVKPQALREGYFSNQPDESPNSRVIDLGARFDRLPPAAATALVSAVRDNLSIYQAPIDIMPGDHYLGDNGTVAVTQTPLQGMLQMEATPPDSAAPSDSEQCQSFCDALTNWASSGNTGGLWSLAVVVKESWRVTTTGGQVIAAHAPLWPNNPPFDTLSPEAQALRKGIDVRWDGAWGVSSQTGFDICNPSPLVGALLKSSPQVDTSSMSLYEGQGIDTGQGCVVTLLPRNPGATSLYLLYRLGALLAANDAAHRAFPGLPIASHNEQALARSIMGQL